MPRPTDPCPCGSGKKYKFCHGQKPTAKPRASTPPKPRAPKAPASAPDPPHRPAAPIPAPA
ncbi:MAG TPA: SEC-C metal-binding domain-containing protein, partial [Gemmatimonadales bacterium]|nr:SEC-C metal-binding domain-containing protein [Gemmatimonadales bacterium]